RRVTSEADLELVRMVLSGVTNKRLVGTFTAAGVRAVGISGEDGALLRGTVAPGAPLGRVGEALVADATLLRDLIAAGWTPVVSPLATDADDTPRGALNVNGDDAAAAIAEALGASELLLVADVPGVLRDGAVLPALDATAIAALAASGVATGGMLAKLEAALRAATAGVTRVRVGALDAITDLAAGTRITRDVLTPEPQLR
ncbi:MAG: acetylglutamate kinase, partial [Gemmatimonadaceae bacterium]|nr:acetylglutamate kinase [Gemmatimonadaceae bacterium]